MYLLREFPVQMPTPLLNDLNSLHDITGTYSLETQTITLYELVKVRK